ncbi:hypothetical protein HMPREF1279_00488 [Propionibacterium sp. KPL1852]|nr:hypothetical protein HMPREF1271_00794 [Propionibacterium sp. KPL1838]ERS69383.1 hypothetical protein HMPREF1279_00488 [Propionibacterium sp. KPL1852]
MLSVGGLKAMVVQLFGLREGEVVQSPGIAAGYRTSTQRRVTTSTSQTSRQSLDAHPAINSLIHVMSGPSQPSKTLNKSYPISKLQAQILPRHLSPCRCHLPSLRQV